MTAPSETGFEDVFAMGRSLKERAKLRKSLGVETDFLFTPDAIDAIGTVIVNTAASAVAATQAADSYKLISAESVIAELARMKLSTVFIMWIGARLKLSRPK